MTSMDWRLAPSRLRGERRRCASRQALSVLAYASGLTAIVATTIAPAFGAPRPRMSGPWGVAYPAQGGDGPRPPIVFLHGMWAGPEQHCEPFVRAATPFGVLLCPRANARGGAGFIWSGAPAVAERAVLAAMHAVDGSWPGALARTDGTLVGYSNGAWFASELPLLEPHAWSGLVLIGLKLDLNAEHLRAAGVRRVVLAAGDRDAARDALAALATHLAAEGLSARFVSLGKGGHEFPSDMSERMCEAIAWVRAAPSSACAIVHSDEHRSLPSNQSQ